MALSTTCTVWEAAIRRLYCIVLAMMLCLGSAMAQDVTVVSSLPFGATYVAEGWVPVRVEVKNATARPITGTVRISPIDRALPETRSGVSVPPQSRVIRMLWGYFTFNNPQNNLVARVTFHDSTGAQLARVDMSGVSSASETQYYPNGIFEHGLMIGFSGAEDTASDYITMDRLGDALRTAHEIRSSYVQLDPRTAPSSWVPYRTAHAVQIRSMDPDELSPEARNAIIDYVKSGGVLLISAPNAREVAGSWVEPLLPVRLIGNREMKQAPGLAQGQVMAFPEYLECAEATEGDGKVLIRDGQFVHAAYRELGLGRVVFTSFPSGALDPEDADSGIFWFRLLGFDRRPIGVEGSSAQDEYAQLMEPLLGRKAASWGVAAAAVGALVLLVIIAQVIWRGAARPTAFKISLAASVLIAAGFSLLAAMRQETEPLQEARLTIVEASRDGSLTNEYAAISGSQQILDRQVADSYTSLRPVIVRQDPPVLSQWPATLQRIEVNPQRVDLVSLATAVNPSLRAWATGRFGPDGLTVTVNNELGATLGSVQLGWGAYRMSMPAIAPGQNQATVGQDDLRPMDEFVSATGLASQDEQHKGQILKSLLSPRVNTRARDTWPTIYGWADALPSLTSIAGVQPDRSGSQTLVRIPLTIEPSQGRVRIDGVFNSLHLDLARGLPYDAARHEFIASILSGEWLIGVQYPREIGLLKPTRARLNVDLETSQQVVQIRVGQCPGGRAPKTPGNLNGRLVADWSAAVGRRTVQFDCTADDVDEQGRLWLRLSVQRAGSAGAMGVEPQWQFGQFTIDLEGDVTQGDTQP